MEKLNSQIKVAYIEARKHKICIVSVDGTETIVSCSIDTAEEKCREKKNFVRCQRSYIVNLEAVSQIVGNFDKLIMKDGTEISVSRSRETKQAMRSAYLSIEERRIFDLFGDD